MRVKVSENNKIKYKEKKKGRPKYYQINKIKAHIPR